VHAEAQPLTYNTAKGHWLEMDGVDANILVSGLGLRIFITDEHRAGQQ